VGGLTKTADFALYDSKLLTNSKPFSSKNDITMAGWSRRQGSIMQGSGVFESPSRQKFFVLWK
jgi:hypothetical protein